MSDFHFLFSPLKIGSVVVPNRIHFAAHMTNFGERNRISDRHIHYYRERARGGCGLITTEELTVHPTDLAYARLVDAYQPYAISGFLKLTRAIQTNMRQRYSHN